MSTSGIFDSLTVYGAHAIGACVATLGVCKIAKAINKYCFRVETSGKTVSAEKSVKSNVVQKLKFSSYLVPALGFCAGLATTWLIATSPKAQYVAVMTAKGALMGT